MSRLSVITLTLNEESNIGACLESVRWADERLVLDSGSSDRTVEIAQQCGAQVHRVQWQGYGGTRNQGLSLCTGDWVLWLDADERVTPELAAEIQEIVRRDDTATVGYAVARRAYFLGKWIRHCGWYPSRVVRLFRRGSAKFSDSNVHEQLAIEGSIGTTRHDILHFTDPDLHHYFAKFDNYTSLAATDLVAGGRAFRVIDLLVRPPFMFVKMYFLRAGFLDGVHGLILSALSAAYVFTKYAKLFEKGLQQRQGGRPT
jgi:glycosyltransferase involved in cell wall biosynthesis